MSKESGDLSSGSYVELIRARVAAAGTSEEDQARLRFWRISTFWVMLIGYIGYYLCRANLPAAFPLLAAEFNYSKAELGLIASASEIAYAIGKFINGPLGDKVGGRRIFLVGMFGAVVCNVAFAFSPALPVFIAVWCVCRYFLSMGWGGIAKTIGAWYPPERNGTVMGLISLNFMLGGVLAPLFAGLLVYLGSGWQGLFLWPALATFVLLIWSFFASKDSPDAVVPGAGKAMGGAAEGKDQIADLGEEEGNVKEIMLSLLKLGIFRQLLVYSFLTTALRSVFFFWLPAFLISIGMGDAGAIISSAVFPLVGAVGTVGLGWYTDNYAKNGDRAKAMYVMLFGLTLSLVTLAVVAMGEAPNAALVVTLSGCCGFFLLGPYSMSSGCLALDIAGSKGAGSCTGLIDGVGYIGGALAAFGSGWASDFLGWGQVFGVLAVFAGLSAASAVLMSFHFQRVAAAKAAT